MGDHTGAKVALELACQRPDQVRRVIMLSLTVWVGEEIAHRAEEGPLVERKYVESRFRQSHLQNLR